MNIQAHLNQLTSVFQVNKNKENAEKMERYMKNNFPFYGIKSTERRQLSQTFHQSVKQISEEEVDQLVKKLWELPERENQYVALDFLIKRKKKLVETDIDLLEYLIVTKSWWDTVDLIASHLVGTLFMKYPQFVHERGEQWIQSDHLWLQRTMLIFQLRYKEETDEQLLFSTIERLNDKNEFFIQKAIGWALREYSKTNPEAVNTFIETHHLSPLSKREGLKIINKQFK